MQTDQASEIALGALDKYSNDSDPATKAAIDEIQQLVSAYVIIIIVYFILLQVLTILHAALIYVTLHEKNKHIALGSNLRFKPIQLPRRFSLIYMDR